MDEREAVARRYGEHLSDTDLLTLAGQRPDAVRTLRRDPTLILDLLDRPAVTDAVVETTREDPQQFSYVSPFLVFAAAVHRAANALVGSSYVVDRAGPRSRVPVFDAPALAAFAAAPRHRLFLAELLASYARVASGVIWRRTGQGWRRQRWDELDLPRLAGLLDSLPREHQPGVWRRIGDGALFLAGVFPDYAERALGLVEVARLQRMTGLPLRRADGPILGLLEELAGRAYERTGGAVPRSVVEAPQSARRLLTLVADRYLFPGTPPWLAPPGA